MAANAAQTLRPPPPGLPSKVPQIVPNPTLYVKNIPSAKIKKEDLRMALYMLFSTYGPVLDVVALKTTKMRGQAHVVFRDIQASTQAMRSLDGFEFFGFRLNIEYAKTRSNVFAKLDGSFKPSNPSANVETTELQQSIFNAPVPGASAAASAPALHGLPSKPQAAADQKTKDPGSPQGGRGQKRAREEDDDEEDSDVAMEEDSGEDDD